MTRTQEERIIEEAERLYPYSQRSSTESKIAYGFTMGKVGFIHGCQFTLSIHPVNGE
jgi:hypothetical protein